MKKFIYQYAPYYKNYKIKFFIAFVGILLVAGGTSGTAYIMKPLLDDIFINKNQQMLTILPLFVIVLYIAKGFGRFIQVYYISFIGQDIIRQIRDKLYKHILYLDIEFFNKNHSGDLISKITNDINRIQSAVSTKIATIFQEVLTIVALVSMTIYLNSELAFYGLVIMPLVLWPLSILAKKMKKISFSSQEKNSDIVAHLGESFSNIEIIKASFTQQLECDRFYEHNKKFFKLNMKAVKTNEMVSPIMEIMGALAIATVIVIGGQYVIDDKMTAGSFFSFMTALFMLYTPIKRLSSVYNSLQDAIAANERTNKLFEIYPTIQSGNDILSNNIQKISFKDVTLMYDSKTAIKNITIDIKRGEKLALIGPSGGGKTSFINLIMKFYEPISGTIEFDDLCLKDIKLSNLRQNIAIITQRVYIFNDTVANNICYGQKYDKNKLIKTLKSLDAYDFVLKLKDGLDTVLDEAGTNLSGGQKQRIAIARAIYKNPQILILDEATSALDNKTEKTITKLLEKVSKDKIVIIIAHRLSTIKNAKKVALFKDGKIICHDSIEYLEKNCKEYQKLNNLS